MRLYLLVPTTELSSPTVSANGQHWALQPFDLPDSDAAPSLVYSCVSYTWGRGREPSPFRSSFLVSDRTVPALQTFTQHRTGCRAVWIDAFCVPLDEPERTQTLESMGYIYAQAAEVLVILSGAAGPALRRMLGAQPHVEVADLAVLEREEWVERAWTYQETVNSKDLFLTCEGDEGVVVPAKSFMERSSHALVQVKGSLTGKRKMYPRLLAFEDIMTDYWHARFEGRAALNVMSNMDRRVQTQAADHFYAMIGAISAERASGVGKMHPCEAFMSVCEKKGDFSFIYSAAEREKAPLKRWRPVAGDLPSILPWSGWGTGQPGHLSPQGLWLDEMLVMRQGPPQPTAEKFVRDWLESIWGEYLDEAQTMEESAYAALEYMGFPGSKKWVSAAGGFFFPWQEVSDRTVARIIVSTTLGWRMGTPALLEFEDGGGKVVAYNPGVFIGNWEKGETVSVLVG